MSISEASGVDLPHIDSQGSWFDADADPAQGRASEPDEKVPFKKLSEYDKFDATFDKGAGPHDGCLLCPPCVDQ